jgi:hypothetical protein
MTVHSKATLHPNNKMKVSSKIKRIKNLKNSEKHRKEKLRNRQCK